MVVAKNRVTWASMSGARESAKNLMVMMHLRDAAKAPRAEVDFSHWVPQTSRITPLVQSRLKAWVSRSKDRTSRLRESRRARLLIHPESSFRVVWDFLNLFLMGWTMFELPYSLIFEETTCQWTVMRVLNLCVDILFMSDIFIAFNSSYFDESSFLVMNRTTIVRNYLKSWFLLDLLSSMPADNIVCALGDIISMGPEGGGGNVVRTIKLLRIMKMFRLLRIARVLKRWEAQAGSRAVMSVIRISKLWLILVYSTHLSGCLFYLIAENNVCFASPDNDSRSCDCEPGETEQGCIPGNWLYHYDADVWSSSDPLPKFLASIYFSIMTLSTIGYGDIVPVNDIERAYATVLAMTGAMVFAYCVGSISFLATQSNETDLAINRSIRDVTDFLQYVDLPRVFQTRAKQHLFYTLKKAPHLATHPLENLPRRFRNEILDQVTLSTLGATPFFQSVDADCRSQFASMLRPISLRAGEYLFKALETGMEMYFLVSGEVDVWDIDETMIVGKLVRGDFVGEIALFEEAFPCRTSSVKARTDVELLELRREDFHEKIKPFFPDVFQAIKDTAYTRIKGIDLSFIEAHLKAMSTSRCSLPRKVITLELQAQISRSIESFKSWEQETSGESPLRGRSPGNGNQRTVLRRRSKSIRRGTSGKPFVKNSSFKSGMREAVTSGGVLHPSLNDVYQATRTGPGANRPFVSRTPSDPFPSTPESAEGALWKSIQGTGGTGGAAAMRQELVKQLASMGFSDEVAMRAVQQGEQDEAASSLGTKPHGGTSVEPAQGDPPFSPMARPRDALSRENSYNARALAASGGQALAREDSYTAGVGRALSRENSYNARAAAGGDNSYNAAGRALTREDSYNAGARAGASGGVAAAAASGGQARSVSDASSSGANGGVAAAAALTSGLPPAAASQRGDGSAAGTLLSTNSTNGSLSEGRVPHNLQNDWSDGIRLELSELKSLLMAQSFVMAKSVARNEEMERVVRKMSEEQRRMSEAQFDLRKDLAVVRAEVMGTSRSHLASLNTFGYKPFEENKGSQDKDWTNMLRRRLSQASFIPTRSTSTSHGLTSRGAAAATTSNLQMSFSPSASNTSEEVNSGGVEGTSGGVDV